MAGMWGQGWVVRTTEEGQGLVGLGSKLGNYAHCTGEYSLLSPIWRLVNRRPWVETGTTAGLLAPFSDEDGSSGGDEKWMIHDGLDIQDEREKKKKLTMTLRFWSEPWEPLLEWESWDGLVSCVATTAVHAKLGCLATLRDGAVGGAAPLGRGCKGVIQWQPHYYQNNSPLSLTSPATLGSSVHAAHLASLPSIMPHEGDNWRGDVLEFWAGFRKVVIFFWWNTYYPISWMVFLLSWGWLWWSNIAGLECPKDASLNLAFLMYSGLDCIIRKLFWKEAVYKGFFFW